MRGTFLLAVAGIGIGLAGCDGFKGPRLAIPSSPSTSKGDEQAKSVVQTPPKPPFRYQGRTLEQWAELLANRDPEVVYRACHALKVVGAQGRPYLVQGLENPNAETRRQCLEALSVSDLRCYGEQGKQLLVKLSGDPVDMRIRERASAYIMQWNRSVPSP